MKTAKSPLYKATQRLIIRTLNEADYDNWSQAYSCMRPVQNEWDESNWKESELTKTKFKSLLKTQRAQAAADKFYSFGIFRKDDGVMIGLVTLMDVSRAVFQNAYLGYRIFNNYWGKGYAQEACKAALHMAFRELHLHRVEAGIAPTNKKSIRVAKAIGLRREGLSSKRLLVRNKWTDMVLYAGTTEDFKIRHKHVI